MKANRNKPQRKTQDSPTPQSTLVSPERLQAKQLSQGERFRLLLQGVTDYAIFLLDTEGQVTCWNSVIRKQRSSASITHAFLHLKIFKAASRRKT